MTVVATSAEESLLASAVHPQPYLVPRVNLLPPEIHERQVLRRVQLGAGTAILAVAVLVGLGWYGAQGQVATAKNNLAAAQTQTAALQGQLARLAHVRQTFAAVDTAKGLLTQAMGTQIQWSRFLTDLSLTIPANVWLTSYSATETPPSATAAASPSTGAAGGTAAGTALLPGQSGPGTLGTVSFSGVALRRDDVATWLESLAQEKGYAAAYATSITETVVGTQIVYDFTSTVTLTSAALWGHAPTLLGG